MKKYNLSEIMKRAWELKRSYSCRALNFAQCLKRAWAEAKLVIERAKLPKFFKNGMEITIDGVTRTLNRWTKGNMDRVYINGGSRNGDGFVDIKNKIAYLNGNTQTQKYFADAILAMQF